jgi:hypothetical protein
VTVGSVPSRPLRGLVAAAALVGLIVGGSGPGAAGDPEPRFVPFSRVMAELSQQPGFLDALLEKLGRDPSAGGILGPEQIEKLRDLIFGKDWEALDHFPTLSIEEMGQAVHSAGRAWPAVPPSAPRATAAAWQPVVEEPLGIPTSGAAPKAERFLKPLGFGLAVGNLAALPLPGLRRDLEAYLWRRHHPQSP